ncbi:hypothetical protein OS965_40955 [Streptomyces sp. H27-G5]|uniref:hypothetical protein n=1 Tax=Streptomyces sp. H27-G5 TaxID=2996698 RepID=UPI00226DC49A|nr:hypothetical protein [Streptomyces sp. H27-G5]MCY0924386.1 hypothetical protein [Streptomyces sp. H27-G5]
MAAFHTNPDHKGSPLLTLTRNGHRTLEAITTRATRAHGVIAEGISPAEIATARDLLRRLIEQARRHHDQEPADETP